MVSRDSVGGVNCQLTMLVRPSVGPFFLRFFYCLFYQLFSEIEMMKIFFGFWALLGRRFHFWKIFFPKIYKKNGFKKIQILFFVFLRFF